MNKKDIIDAYVFLREKNNDIPFDSLDFIKDAALEKLAKIESPAIEDWTKPDENDIIHVPDELDKLFNSIGMQLRFHTISGKGEVETIARMVYIAQKFFNK